MTKYIILLFLAISSVAAQGTPPVAQTNIVRLETARLVWDANTATNISGYLVEMLTGGPEAVSKFTTNTFMRVLDLRPSITNGLHTFRVSAVNTHGFEGPFAEASTNLVRGPTIVLNLRLESSGGSATATATATVK